MRRLIERLLALLRRHHSSNEWLSPGNAITRAIESGREFAPLQVPHATLLPSNQSPASRTDLLAAIEAALQEPVYIEEPPRIVITDDSAVPVVSAPAAEEGVLKEKKPKRRWWRRAA